MLQKIVEEMKRIVSEVTSPFSYIHDKLVEAMGHVHAEIEELKARVEELEKRTGGAVVTPHPEASDSPSQDDHGDGSKHPGN